jgi:hypothetical protein
MEAIVGAIAGGVLLVCIVLEKINKNLIVLRLQTVYWEHEQDGVQFRVLQSKKVECLTRSGYKVFKSEKQFYKFLLERPDIK